MSDSVRINIDADSRSLSDVQRELKAIKGEMIGLEGEAFTDAAMRAAELETEVKRANDAVRELSGSGDDLARMGSTMGGIGRSLATLDFTAANEGAQRLLVISQGMNFQSAIKSLKQLGGTFVTLGKALLTNPFFLMVGIITAIVVAIYKLMDELGLLQAIMDGVGKVFEWIMIPINALIDGLKQLTDWFGWTNHAGEELAQEELDRLEEVSAAHTEATNTKIDNMDHEIAMARARGEDTIELERERLAFLRLSQAEELKMAAQKARELIILHGEDSEEVQEQLDAIKAIQQARKDSARETELFEAKVAADRKKAAEKEAEDERKRLEKAGADAKRIREQREQERQRELEAEEKLQEDIAKAQMNAQRMIEEQSLKFIEDEIERSRELALFKEQQAWEDLDRTHLTNEQIEILEEQHLQRLEDIRNEAAEKQKLKEEEDRIKLEELRKEYLNAIREEEKLTAEEQAQEDFETELERMRELLEAKAITQEEFDNLEIQRKQELQDRLVEIQKEANEKIRKDNLAKNQADVEMASTSVGQINDILQSFAEGNEENAKKMFNVNKAANIAMAAMNTGLAVTAALTAGGNPLKLATGAQFVEAGIAAATGAANIAQIARTQFGGGSSGGGSAPPTPSQPSTSTQSTPQFQMFGQANETGASSEDFGGVERDRNQEKQQPVRAYVQWSDIDETGNNDSNLKNEMQL